MHNRLKDRLRNQLIRLTDTRAPDEALLDLRAEIAERLPVRTGTMAQNVLKIIGPRVTATGLEYGLGDLQRIGNPNRAPRGTIAKFLKDYPQFRLPGGLADSRLAWWALSTKAKQVLQAERQAGKYGGGYLGVASGKSAYFYAQEGSEPDWAASAEAAGIAPQHFVREAYESWKESSLPKYVRVHVEFILS